MTSINKTKNNRSQDLTLFEENPENNPDSLHNLLQKIKKQSIKINLDGNIIDVSSHFSEIIEFDSSELLNSPFSNYFTHQSDYINFVKRIIKGDGIVMGYETSMIRKDGSTLLASINAHHLVDKNGKICCIEGTIKNITRERQTKKDFQDAEEMYRGLVEMSPDAIIVHINGMIKFANKHSEEIFGVPSAKDLIGKSLMDFIHPDYQIIVKERINSFNIQGDRLPPVELKMILPNEKIKMIETTGRKINYSGKSATQVILRDISKRKEIERQLEIERALLETKVKERTKNLEREIIKRRIMESQLIDSKKQLQYALENMPCGFVMYDSDERLLAYNEQFLDFFSSLHDILVPGTKAETIFYESVKRNGTVIPEIETDTIEERIKLRMNMFRNPGKSHEVQLSDGRWLLAVEKKTSDGGYISVRTDITDRKILEHKLSDERRRLIDALESITYGAAIYDQDDRLVYCNQNYIGYTSDKLSDFIKPGMLFKDFIYKLGKANFYVDTKKLGFDKWFKQKLDVHLNGGTEESLTFKGEWRRIDHYKISSGGRLIIFSDITKWKQSEEQLLIAKEELAVAFGLKNEFMKNMTHEINGPLKAINDYADLISQEIFGPINNETYLEYASFIKNESSLVLDIISEIINYSAYDIGVLDIEEDVFDFNDLINESISMLRSKSERALISIKNLTDKPVPFVYGDKQKIKQIITNLTSISSQTLNKSRLRSFISFHATQELSGDLSVLISANNGDHSDLSNVSLMSSNDIEDIVFFDSTPRAGLIYCIKIMELHDGSLKVLKNESGDISFLLKFPSSRLNSILN